MVSYCVCPRSVAITNTLAYYGTKLIMFLQRYIVHVSYLQHFIFIVTSKLAQKARMLHYTWLERFALDKHYSLLGPFISYEENKVL
jgi:hypothetical protein